MAATVKIVILEHQQKQDGTINVKIRITHNRSSAYISTPYFVTKRDIKKNKRTNIIEITDNFLNIEIYEYLNRLRKTIVKLGTNISLYNAKELADYLKKSMNQSTVNLDFLEYMKEYYLDMKSKGRSAYQNYQAAYNRLYGFTKGKLNFNEISSNFLYSFENHLIDENVGSRGIVLYMTAIKAVFNEGRRKYNDEDKGEIIISNYPFNRYKLPKETEPKDKAAGMDVVRLLYHYNPVTGLEELSRDMFLLSFYLMGMNAVDIYNCHGKILDNRITYQRSKTRNSRSDNAEISIYIQPEAEELIKKYTDRDKKRIFNIYKRYSSSKNFNSSLSDGFVSIRKKLINYTGLEVAEELKLNNLTMYSARHSFASIAFNNCHIPEDHIARCLNHINTDRKITSRYIKKDWSIIDSCHRKVLDYVNEKISL